MSRDISWISEIKNNTQEDYIMWCWDTDNEGEFRDFATNEVLGLNDGGQQFVIKAGAHLSVSGCGIPDGGQKEGRPKMRVICAKSIADTQSFNGDPGKGFRMNRVMFDDAKNMDRIVYHDHGNLREMGSIAFPSGTEQNLILRIDDDGIFIDVYESRQSTEWKAYLFGKQLEDFVGETVKEFAKSALNAARDLAKDAAKAAIV